MQSLSIIIISFNRVSDTLELLSDISNLSNKELLANVVILNNKSTDDYFSIIEFIEQNKQIPFEYVVAPENLGVSRGRNYATKFAKGEIFIYLDDDVNLNDKDILNKMLHALNTEKYGERKLGVVSFKVLYKSTMQLQQNALPHKKFEKYKDRNEFPTYYYAGCAHAKTKEAWEAAGPYPENFFYGMEEYDFSFRVLDNGYYIKYDNSATILHKESPLGRKTKAEKLKMMWVNKSKVAWRYLPKKYFYSTAIMWSIEYLRKTNFHLKGFLTGWKEIFKIPSAEKRTPIGNSTLEYLKKVEARLWY